MYNLVLFKKYLVFFYFTDILSLSKLQMMGGIISDENCTGRIKYFCLKAFWCILEDYNLHYWQKGDILLQRRRKQNAILAPYQIAELIPNLQTQVIHLSINNILSQGRGFALSDRASYGRRNN